MQFHRDGFRTGDPRVAPQVEAGAKDDVDVLIVGAGPAGLTLAAYLAQFGDINSRLVEAKDGPLKLGQADGIACRSMEMFQVFGFANRVMEEAYWVNDTVFWGPSEAGGIQRTGRIQDVEDGLSEMPHVILNQARVHDFYLEVMRNGPRRLAPDYETRFVGYARDGGGVFVALEGPNGPESCRAKYLVGCDGARSAVRGAMGLALEGEAAHQAWGVMDVLAVTDFPDIRFKCVIRSGPGNIVLIPREGGNLFRVYVELDRLGAQERISARNITLDQLVAAANRIFAPYYIEPKEVPWWSVYEIGQRLCPRFDDGPDPRVFIAGDACHTHSPKAGQGMNVSMGDGFNLAWKLAAVLRGDGTPGLLQSYNAERHQVAADLIGFDRHWAKRFAERPAARESQEFQEYFSAHQGFTAGVSFRYAPSLIVGDGAHQGLAEGFVEGTRVHSAPVRRAADGKLMELGHVVEADGRWRLFAFADRAEHALGAFCHGFDAALPVDLRVVLQHDYREVEVTGLPEMLLPCTGALGLQDFERVFCAEATSDIFQMRGVDRDGGALVLVRPDQHISHVLPLENRLPETVVRCITG
ncbi:Salicylate hydroxylase [Candidatus Rhodobacter oscarellae]|uniref:Salicylate hydroxylase n=1 Tax=Candidatus Rhodobacter oscarellae TaxID=1675527 RepID=A0A0J9E4Q2_9RHOB|nr:FAD-dependent monooxygenase [Candidatus Rhodobacter lobularis]KMW56799.1 Salicylate hydroxylase [Candidatus Rhodobacter lobularis]